MKTLRLAHLYPDEMNIYGDRGNILALQKRLQWRGYDLQIIPVEPGVDVDFKDVDLVFGGGGQDRGQMVISRDLQERQQQLRAAAEDGVVMLVVCGLYQLFGQNFQTQDGEQITGINLFAARTEASSTRMIGNIVVDSPFGQLVGFENHSGQTVLEDGQQPLGTVSKGHGNNSRTRDEGAVYKNVFGSYLHGPLLPKNPRFTDELLARALRRKYGKAELKFLDDSLELRAATIAKKRPQ